MSNETFPPHSDQQRIKALIFSFFEENLDGRFYGYNLHDFVFTRMRKYIYPDTIFREMRRMRQNREINYKCLSICESLYFVSPDQPEC